MKALVLSQARLREPSLVERFDYYAKLLRRRLPLERRNVKRQLREQIPDGWRVVALDERGERLSSLRFADRIRKRESDGTKGLVFLIGAADGLSPDDLSVADEKISLSPMTLPHQLCFVILAEQLYRATSIIRGEKYHRE